MRRRIREHKKFNTMSLTSNCKRYKGEIDNEKNVVPGRSPNTKWALEVIVKLEVAKDMLGAKLET